MNHIHPIRRGGRQPGGCTSERRSASGTNNSAEAGGNARAKSSFWVGKAEIQKRKAELDRTFSNWE